MSAMLALDFDFADTIALGGVSHLPDAELHWLEQVLAPKSNLTSNDLDGLAHRASLLNMALRLCEENGLSPDAATVAACRLELERRGERLAA